MDVLANCKKVTLETFRLIAHRAAVWFVAMRAAGIPPPTQPRSPQQHSVSV